MIARKKPAVEEQIVDDDLAHAVVRSERIGLTHILRPEINMAVWRRDAPRAVTAWLSRISGEHLLARPCDIDSPFHVRHVAAAIVSKLPVGDPISRAGAAALAEDAKTLADMFAQISTSSLLRLRLEWIAEQPCPRFHADRVPMRLLCTYRGAGTEWLANDVILPSQDAEPHPSTINRLGTGDVAIMKGALADGSTGALRHRSPPLKAPAEWRLFLALDPVYSL